MQSNDDAYTPQFYEQMQQAVKTLEYLYVRWLEEDHYEIFDEYVKAITRCLPEGSTEINMTRHPFEVTFTDVLGARRFIKVNGSKVEWGHGLSQYPTIH